MAQDEKSEVAVWLLRTRPRRRLLIWCFLVTSIPASHAGIDIFCQRLMFGEIAGVATFEVRVEQLLPGVAQQRVGEDEVESAEQQMIRVYQIIADHREVPWSGKKDGVIFFVCPRANLAQQTKTGLPSNLPNRSQQDSHTSALCVGTKKDLAARREQGKQKPLCFPWARHHTAAQATPVCSSHLSKNKKSAMFSNCQTVLKVFPEASKDFSNIWKKNVQSAFTCWDTKKDGSSNVSTTHFYIYLLFFQFILYFLVLPILYTIMQQSFHTK